MAGSYQAKIDVIIGGLREVAALEGRLEALQSTINAINKDPIDLNLGGRGRGRDLSGKLSKNVNDLVRNFNNFGKSFSSVNKQAVLFGDLMSQTALKSTGEFKKQDVAVKNLATAYTKATGEAARFEQQQVNLIRTSKGLQTTTQREIELLRRRAKVLKLQEQKRRGRNLQQDLALGAGFPLLFGGGAGSVLGGVAGALAGGGKGGFGLQVLGSAIGQQVDAFVQATQETAVALTSTAGALELMREKSLFTSEGSKELAAQLEEQGDVAALASHLTEELVSQIGDAGVIALQDLGSTTNETTKLWNQLTAQLQILIAGPLNGFLQLVNNMIGGINDALKPSAQDDFRAIRDRVLASGDAEAIARVTAIEDQVRGVQRKNLRGGGTQITQGSLTDEAALRGVELLKAAGFGPQIAVTDEDRRSITPPKGKRERKSQLPQLKEEVQLQERLNVLTRAIAQARADENPVREAALKMEVELEKQATSIAKVRLSDLPVAEKTEKIREIELDTSNKLFKIQDGLNQARAKQAEKGQEVISSLKDEKALLEAKLNGTEDQVALTQLIAQKTEGLNKTDAERVTKLLAAVDLLKQQNKEADKMQAIFDQIGQSIASGVVDTLSAAVDQTKSLADAAANTLRNIANTLLQLGVNTALGAAFPGASLFKNLPGFASGGRPPVNRPSIVGERGPELFVPSTSGTIVPSGKFGGATNVVVNVDAKGTSASGSNGSAKQLGGLIGAAVQAELVKQQRPGGLLAR